MSSTCAQTSLLFASDTYIPARARGTREASRAFVIAKTIDHG